MVPPASEVIIWCPRNTNAVIENRAKQAMVMLKCFTGSLFAAEQHHFGFASNDRMHNKTRTVGW